MTSAVGRFLVGSRWVAVAFTTAGVVAAAPAAAHCGGHGESCGPEETEVFEWCEDDANVYWLGTFVRETHTTAYWCNSTDPVERVSCNFAKPCASDADCGDGLCDGSGPNGEGYCNCRDCTFARPCTTDVVCGLGGRCDGGGVRGEGFCNCFPAWCPTARCSTDQREPDLLPGQCTAEATVRSEDDVRCWPPGIEAVVPCAGPAGGASWNSHGQYVSELAHLLRDLVEAGTLTDGQMDALMEVGGASTCGH